jgi:phosphotriesterase-related protein
MYKSLKYSIIVMFVMFGYGCFAQTESLFIRDVNGARPVDTTLVWLTHEHLLVDFIGADSISQERWDDETVIQSVLPYLDELKAFHVSYFVDATPDFLGRDVQLLQKISDRTGIRIITNTGLYGARKNLFIPKFAFTLSADQLAARWIGEYENGIEGTSVRPGFIKIGIDNADPLDPMHQKLVRAAALTHLKTGLTIASHTGKARGLWPQLEILKEMGVSAAAFIWVHASAEDNNDLLKAARMGCWISFDKFGWDTEKDVEKILFARDNGFLNRILISHDAGWYDPAKAVQNIRGYTNIFRKVWPALQAKGFTEQEFRMLVSVNPAKAFGIQVR